MHFTRQWLAASAMYLVLLCVLLPYGPVLAETPTATAGQPPLVSMDTLRARIREVGDSTDLDEATSSKLIERYRKALSFLETAGSNQEASRSFNESRKTAPARTEQLRNKLAAVQQTDADIELTVTDQSSLDAVNQELVKEKANLSAVSAKLSQIDNELANQIDRPSQAHNRITEIKHRLEQIATDMKLPPPDGELQRLSEARRWMLETEKHSLDTEILMLDQELLSQQVRVALLQAQRDYTANSQQRIQVRVSKLENMLSGKRIAEATQARTETEQAQREVEGKHPLLQELAKSNAGLSEEITRSAAALEEVAAEDDAARDEAKRINDDYQQTRQKLDIAGLNEALGEVMLQHRRLLPDAREFRKKARVRENAISQISLRQIQLEDEQRKLRNIVTYLDEYTSKLEPDVAAAIRSDLEALALTRLSLLNKANETNRDYLRALGELNYAQTQLDNAVQTYDQFMSERLLWIRNATLPDLDTLRSIPADVSNLLSPRNWLEALGNLRTPTAATPVLLLSLVLVALYVFRGKRLYQKLLASGKEVGRPLTDRFRFTLEAFGYSVLIAAVWPFLFAAMGLQLSLSLEMTDFSRAIGVGLLWLAPTFFFLRMFRVLCIKGGVAEIHFRWSSHSLKILQREFGRLMYLFLPGGFIAVTLINYDPGSIGGAVGRMAVLLAQVGLGFFFYYLFEPRQGGLKWYLARRKNSLLYRLRYLWFVLATAIPVVFIILSVLGYLYTAGTLTGSLARTLWLIISLFITHQLVVRWLLLTQRKLTYQAALDKHKAERAAAEARETAVPGSESDAEYVKIPDIDLESLSTESRKLLNMALVVIGAVGLYTQWSDILPAFGILREVTLWHYMGVDAGEEKLLPVTLADLGLAIVTIIIMVVATRRVPAFLEMVLLQRLRITSGGRYTARTLTRYTIIGVGIVLAISMLGGSWSKIQWLVAALGVGIGFGLQEIVANFICGLIILFERPIRVGDRVTIGDTEGFVTRIQIRATTIQTFDRTELLVPNKEFITGRLLNWSLSDTVTRLVIPVGVAYGSDVRNAIALMIEAAGENERVLDDPKPYVSFEEFGDNSLLLVLRCFLDSLEYRLATISDLHTAINDKFEAAGIVISFPQRDLHLDTLSPLDIRIHNDKGIPETK
ncbi:MAG: mechanosensitive ion channel domain-containing protein [Pseudomonadota bacterium]